MKTKAIEEVFSKTFDHWGIRLPGENLSLRLPGRIRQAGWNIGFFFGEKEGEGYLEYYATHRMTYDDHVRIYESGKTESLPAIQGGYLYEPEIPGDEERARNTVPVC